MEKNAGREREREREASEEEWMKGTRDVSYRYLISLPSFFLSATQTNTRPRNKRAACVQQYISYELTFFADMPLSADTFPGLFVHGAE